MKKLTSPQQVPRQTIKLELQEWQGSKHIILLVNKALLLLVQAFAANFWHRIDGSVTKGYSVTPALQNVRDP